MPHTNCRRPRRSVAPVAMLAVAALTQAAEPRLDRLDPQGVRRGGEATVRLHGPRLGKDPQELLLHEPGVEVAKLERDNDNTVVATLRLAEDCPLGRHAVRLRTATGVSNLVTLHVGALECVDEAEPNNTPDAAQAVPFGRTVRGVIKPEDEDVFAIEVAEGQRVSVEVEGLRLGRTFFDPWLEVLDASGEVIATSDDQTPAYSDPFLTVTAPADGKLLVRVRESAYRGDNRSTYLLHVGDFPRPTAVYPPVAVRGAASEVRWVGAGDAIQSVTAPADAAETVEVHAQDGVGVAPTPLKLWVADAPPTLEAEPNNGRDQAAPMAAPGVSAGVIGEPGDLDHFRFAAKKGQTLDLRVRARRLRSPLDSVLRVFSAEGKRLAGNDDDRGEPDAYVSFKAPTDGEYVAQIEDRLGRGSPSHTYALDIDTPRPYAEVQIEERRRYEATTVEVPRGGRTTVLMKVSRSNSSDPLRLAFDNLPAGVHAETFPLPGNFHHMPIVFTADAEAPLAATLSPVSATPVEPAEGVDLLVPPFRQQTWLVRGRNNVDVWSHWTGRAAVAVTQRLPFSVSLAQPKAPLPKNGSTELKVVAQRAEGFDQPIAVRVLYHSPGMSSNRSRSIGKGQTEATIPVTTDHRARTGEWPVVVVAETNLDGRVYASSEFVTLSIVEPYFDVGVPVVTARQGESAECVVKLTPRTEFSGPATIELANLPPGVSADPITVEAGAESAPFQVRFAADARAGRHRGVHARVKLSVEGEPVEYRQGWSDMQIDPAEPPVDQTAMRDQEVRR